MSNCRQPCQRPAGPSIAIPASAGRERALLLQRWLHSNPRGRGIAAGPGVQAEGVGLRAAPGSPNRQSRTPEEKCPKLQRCKDRGARTVLVLECGDIALSDSVSIRKALSRAAEERADTPDEIYLVETKVETWHMWPMNPAAETAFPCDFNTECKAFESADLDDLVFQNAPEIQCDVCVNP